MFVFPVTHLYILKWACCDAFICAVIEVRVRIGTEAGGGKGWKDGWILTAVWLLINKTLCVSSPLEKSD